MEWPLLIAISLPIQLIWILFKSWRTVWLYSLQQAGPSQWFGLFAKRNISGQRVQIKRIICRNKCHCELSSLQQTYPLSNWLFHSDNPNHLPKLSYWTIPDRLLCRRPVRLDDVEYLHKKRTNRFANLCEDTSFKCFDRSTTAYWLFVGTLARGGRNRCQKLEEEFEFICKTVIAPTLIPSPSI